MRFSLAQDAVLDQQEAQAAILGTVEPGGTGADQEGDFGGHGGWYG